MADLTLILRRLDDGDPHAAGELLPLIYDELRRLAAQRLANEKSGHSLEATALVHEVYLRLVPQTADGQRPSWDNRGHFFAAAAEAMRRILIENARRSGALKHGGQRQRIELDPAEIAAPLPDDRLLALDEALGRLAETDPEKARLVELRFFAGLTHEEAAAVLGIAPITAKRHWRYARAWLHREIEGRAATGGE